MNDEKYEGTPDMLRQTTLRRYVADYFENDMAEIDDALIFGLGPKVWKVLDAMVEARQLDADRVFNGVFHGSPENTYRINWLTGLRGESPPWRTNPNAYDNGRNKFRRHVLRIDDNVPAH